jgi:hypothetical protein
MRGLKANTALARALRSVAFLVNVHSLLLCGLGCCAVYACEQYGLSFALDISIIGEPRGRHVGLCWAEVR